MYACRNPRTYVHPIQHLGFHIVGRFSSVLRPHNNGIPGICTSHWRRLWKACMKNRPLMNCKHSNRCIPCNRVVQRVVRVMSLWQIPPTEKTSNRDELHPLRAGERRCSISYLTLTTFPNEQNHPNSSRAAKSSSVVRAILKFEEDSFLFSLSGL
jgi:hypothetical protein